MMKMHYCFVEDIFVLMIPEHWANWSQQLQTQDFVKVLSLASNSISTDVSVLQRKDKNIFDRITSLQHNACLLAGSFQPCLWSGPNLPHIFHTRTRKGQTFIRDLLPMGHFTHDFLESLR